MTTLTAFEDDITSETKGNIVNSVFGSWGSLSKDNQSAIRQAVGHIKGFRPGRNIPRDVLKANYNKRAKQQPSIFSVFMMPAWIELNPDLYELSIDYMKGTPPPSEGDDKALSKYCAEQAEALVAQIDENMKAEFLVMARYCAINHADHFFSSEPDSSTMESDDTSSIALGMGQFLGWINALPADADEWDTTVPGFKKSLEDIVSQKKKESTNLTELFSALSNLKSDHSGNLDFLQADTSKWSPSNVSGVNEKNALSQLVNSMEEILREYSEMIETASTIVEERKRREKRIILEKAIESRITKINELLDKAEAPTESESVISLRDFINASIKQDEDGVGDKADVAQATGPVIETLTGVEHSEQIRSLNERLAELEEEKRYHDNEVSRLERDVTLWRNLYEDERKNKDESEPDPIPSQFDSIAQVLKVAEARFANKLLFNFNSASDENHPYKSPLNVWNALEWLATTYYDSRTGKAGVPDLKKSLRDVVSEFEYTPHQSNITIGRYPDSYHTQVNERKVRLEEHMGAGVDRDPRHSIRIAFNWDKQSDKVIVGYIGTHQQNAKT